MSNSTPRKAGKATITAITTRLTDIARRRDTRLAPTLALELAASAAGRRSSNEYQSAAASGAVSLPTLEPSARIVMQDQQMILYTDPATGQSIAVDSSTRGPLAMPDGTLVQIQPATDNTQTGKYIEGNIYVATIDHCKGYDFYLATDEKDLERQIAEFCREFWFEQFDSDPEEGMSDSDIIESYFNEAQDEILKRDSFPIPKTALPPSDAQRIPSRYPSQFETSCNMIDEPGYLTVRLENIAGNEFRENTTIPYDFRHFLLSASAKDIRNTLDDATRIEEQIAGTIITDSRVWNDAFTLTAPNLDDFSRFFESLGSEALTSPEDITEDMLQDLRNRHPDLVHAVIQNWNDRLSSIEEMAATEIARLRRFHI